MQYFLSLLLLISFFDLSGQSSLSPSIFAQVVDEAGESIAVGNVLLLRADSSLELGAVFYDGQFSLPCPKDRSYLLKITALGFTYQYVNVTVDSQSTEIDLGTIILQPEFLSGVEVIAGRKTVERRGSDLILNVANTPLRNAGSATDLLRNAPGISQDRNGGLSVLGKGTAVVYIDGQRINSPTALSSLSAQDIQRVEVIKNPPARYEAAGNAVVHIITRQFTLAGYRIGLVQEAGLGRYLRVNSRANGYYKFGDLLLQGTYGFQPRTLGSYFEQARHSIGETAEAGTINRYLLRNRRKEHDFDLRLVYKPRSERELFLKYSGTRARFEKRGNNERTLYHSGLANVGIRSLVTGPTTQQTNTFNLRYTATIDSLGSQLQMAAQYTDFDFDRNERIDQTFPNSEVLTDLERFSDNQNQIEVYTAQVDYQKNWADGLSLEVGLKSTGVRNHSSTDLAEIGDDGSRISLAAFSNDYQYSEAIQAGYFSFNRTTEDWGITAGLRAEYTNSEGRSGLDQNDILFSRAYLDLFPSLSISKQLSTKMSLDFGYAYRINRPIFQDLNPYVLYVDSLVSLRGNPSLLPEYGHSFSLDFNLPNWNFQLSYLHTRDKINQVFRSLDLDEPAAIAFVKENLDFTRLYAATLSRSFQYNSFSAFVKLGCFYDDHRIPDLGGQSINAKWGYSIQANASVNLPAKLRLGSALGYTSRRVDGVYLDNPISFVNLSLSRKFFQDRLQLSLWSNDIFDKFWFRGTSQFNGMRMNYISQGDWHFTKFTLRWSFGKLQTNTSNRRITSSDLNRINHNQ